MDKVTAEYISRTTQIYWCLVMKKELLLALYGNVQQWVG